MKTFLIQDFGAIGDGQALNTQAIQSAIDAAHAAGGGKVVVGDGVFKTGTIEMKSYVELHIESNATLLGSERCEDYTERVGAKHVDLPMLPRWRSSCLLFADECQHIALTGSGTIDCNGTSFVVERDMTTVGQQKLDADTCPWKYVRLNAPTPPRAVFFTGCRNVRINDVTMVNQPSGWSYWIHDCDYVHIDGLDIIADVNYPNNDGIHINSSRHVTVSNCNITTGDDCIVIRANNVSLKENKVCEFVTITNCNLTSYSSGVRLGWTNDGVIRNCTLSNLVMLDCTTGIGLFLPPSIRKAEMDHTNSAGSDVGREATLVENITFSNIIMDKQCGKPILIMAASEEWVKVAAIRNLYFSGVRCRGPELPHLQGRADCPIENVHFTDCTFEQTNGSEFENRTAHGPAYISGELYDPMYLRHVRGLHLNNTQIIQQD